ncbi:MAG: hypothetical protein ABH827_02845 [bacterium]
MNKKKAGFIAIVSLIMVSLLLVLTHQLLRSVWIGSSFIRTMVDREKAEMLVLSGVQIAIAQLAISEVDKKEKDAQVPVQSTQSGTDKKDTPEQKFLRTVLPYMNRWQVFNIKEPFDGVNGQIKVCISCENGKININEAFDFENQKFKPEYEALLKGLEMKGKFKAGEIEKRLTEYLAARAKKLNDISELNKIAGFDNIDIFYSPPKIPQVKSEWKKDPAVPNIDLTIQDIFTIWTEKAEIEPLFFSDSLCAILGLRRPRADDDKVMEPKFKQVIDSFDKGWGNNWDANWKNIQVLYDEKPKFLSNILGIFSKQFEPTVYSVLSCGKVGQVEQRLLVIIKKVKKEQEKSSDNAAQQKEDKENVKNLNTKAPFKIVRAYWL